jgi:hypothetical protein
MTFWWGMTALAAPQQHLGVRGQLGIARKSGDAARSELKQARRGMERGAAKDGVRGGEDSNSERTTQQHAMDEHGIGDIF